MECGGDRAGFFLGNIRDDGFVFRRVEGLESFLLVPAKIFPRNGEEVRLACAWSVLCKRSLEPLGIFTFNVETELGEIRTVALDAGGFIHEAFIQGIEVSRLVYGEGVPTMLFQQLFVPRVHLNNPAEFPFCARFIRDAVPVTTAVVYETRVA
jgi:hypothetical protein